MGVYIYYIIVHMDRGSHEILTFQISDIQSFMTFARDDIIRVRLLNSKNKN